jgi:aldose 1-epimerase
MAPPYRLTAADRGLVLIDEMAPARVWIDPAAGNNVYRFQVQPAGATEPVDVLVPPAPAAGAAGGTTGYAAGNPILFPFPNRVQGGTFTFDGQTYRLPVNEVARGNHIHGLVATATWTVEETGAEPAAGAWLRAAIALDAVPAIAAVYPFACRLTVTTRLREGCLIQEIAAVNTGDRRLPMGFGTHPWFPAVHAGGRREAAEVRVPGRRYWRLESLLPTGETVPVDADPAKFDLRDWHALDGNAYDDVFTDLVRRPDGWSEAGIRYRESGLQLIVEASPAFREWVIYAPLERPVVCLEPYTGTTNAVNLQPRGVDAGLVVLDPGASWTGVIRMSLRRSA